MVAFESGHVVVIGKAKYEHFSPGSSKGRVGNLPDDSDYGPRFAKTGSHSLAVILKSSVGHFDGTRWHRWPMPEGTKPIDLAWHDGSWWLLTETDLYRRQSSSWHAVNLPVEQAPGHQGHAFRRMGAAGGELFISGSVKLEGRKKEFERLWSTHPASQGLQALDAAGAGSGVGTRASATEPPPAPQSAGACDHVFAMFFAVGSQVPLKHDFPKVRKALTGQNQFAQARFVRTEENGKHYFGAFVPNREVGRKLSRHVGLHVARAKPSLLCHKPKVVGELAIDLKTGRARGWKK